ncbi:hypothetical protein EYF80_017934 [Liparis tanakae]|uniref:Uncharacterized protein n=1 Tax=Liparis tanakae TaxID=230148 RepID=A0A4Z2I3E5_9TELE|nr:hypothetical protein EYF80_017934 [Liparis tanakae]
MAADIFVEAALKPGASYWEVWEERGKRMQSVSCLMERRSAAHSVDERRSASGPTAPKATLSWSFYPSAGIETTFGKRQNMSEC